MAKKTLSTKQKKFLEMIIKLHKDGYCEFVCVFPQVVRNVIADNEYNDIAQTALNVVRNDYIKYLKK